MGRNISKSALYQGVGHFEAKYKVEQLRVQPISTDRWIGNGYTITLLLRKVY